MVLVDAQLCRDSLCHRLCVAGEHDGLADAGLLEALDGLCAVGLHHVGDEQIARILAVDGHMDDGAGLGDIGDGEAQLCHQAGITGSDRLAVHLGGDAVAAQLLHAGDAGRVDVLAVSSLDAQGDGVLRPALGQRSGFHKGIFGTALHGADLDDLEGTLGQGAGLIEDDDAGIGQLFQIGRALDENAAGRGAADAAEEAQRDRDDQCAGAADDEEGEGAVDPVAEAGGLAHQQQNDGGNEGQRQRAVADRRGIHPGKAGDKVLGAGLLHAGIFHEVENFRDGGFAELLGGPDLEQAAHVDTAADDLIAGPDIPGQALAGEGGGVEGGSALDDDAVDRHALAGLDHDEGADLDLIGVHLLQPAVLALDVGVVGPDVHQGRDAAAALADSNALEQLADLVEDDNGTALDVIAQREGTHGGDGHQEAFIKGLTVLDAQKGLVEHVPAHHEVGDAVEQQLHRRGQRRQQLEHQHQRQSGDDAVQHFLLFFCHGYQPPFGAVFSDSTGFPHKGLAFHASPGFSTRFSRKKPQMRVHFSFFAPRMLKTPWKLLKTDFIFHIFHAHPGSISRNSDAKDLAVVLDLLAGGEDILHGSLDVRALIELDVHLLGHEADGGLCDAGDRVGGILHLLGAVCAVNFDLVALFHNKYQPFFLSPRSAAGCGRACSVLGASLFDVVHAHGEDAAHMVIVQRIVNGLAVAAEADEL